MVIDIIAVVIIIGCALMAYKQGFVKTFFGLITVILAIVFASMFHKSLGAFIKEKTEIDEFINSVVTESVTNIGENVNNGVASYYDLTGLVATAKDSSFDFSELSGIMDGAGNMAEDFANNDFFNQLPDAISNKINLDDVKGNITSSLSTTIADAVINIMSWIIIYVGTHIILSIVAAILNGIMILPFLREINNLAGLAIGILLGIFRIYIVLAIIYVIAMFVNISPVVNIITNSSFVGTLYNNNLLLKLIF